MEVGVAPAHCVKKVFVCVLCVFVLFVCGVHLCSACVHVCVLTLFHSHFINFLLMESTCNDSFETSKNNLVMKNYSIFCIKSSWQYEPIGHVQINVWILYMHCNFNDVMGLMITFFRIFWMSTRHRQSMECHMATNGSWESGYSKMPWWQRCNRYLCICTNTKKADTLYVHVLTQYNHYYHH